MSRNGRFRSITPLARVGAPHQRAHSPYNPILHTYQPDFYAEKLSAPRVAAKEILQQTNPYDVSQNTSFEFPKRNNPEGNNFFATDQPKKEYNDRGGTPEFTNQLNGWNEVIQSKLQREARAINEQKLEQRLRTQQYKANLDELVIQHSANKPYTRPIYPPSALITNTDFETEYQNATRHCQTITKKDGKQIFDQGIQGYYNPQNTMLPEMPQNNVKGSKPATPLNASPDKRIQNIPKTDTLIEGQDLDQSKLPLITHNEFELNNEQMRKSPFPNNFNQLGVYQGQSNTPERIFNEIIERNRLERIQHDEVEWRSRQEQRRRLYQESQKDNERLMKDKQLERQIERRQHDKTFEQLKAQIDEGDRVAFMKKQTEKGHQRQYSEFLTHQIAQKRQVTTHPNIITPTEKHMLQRGLSPEPGSALPNEKNCYERKLQLSYIDKWLKHTPVLPAENYDRSRGIRVTEDSPPNRNKSYDTSIRTKWY